VPIVDPVNNWAYEVHQYFDSDGSGRYATAAAPPAGWSSVGNQRLASITTWARSIPGTRLFLGEFGVANNTAMLKCLTDCAAWMQANADVWLGGAYWSGGPWWGTYIYSIEPTNLGQPTQADSAQMTALLPQPGILMLRGK
jgi:endoglucanase